MVDRGRERERKLETKGEREKEKKEREREREKGQHCRHFKQKKGELRAQLYNNELTKSKHPPT